MDSDKNPLMQNREGFGAFPDDRLVQLSQQDDQEAFGELVNRHQNSALKVALSILRDHHEAEDEVQNAFCKAFIHIKRFQQDSKFSTWLTRIVVNQCLMRLRQLRRAKFAYLDELKAGEEMVAHELRDLHLSPEQVLGQAQVAQVLESEIRRTPPLLRTVFLLRDVQHLPMPEVAEVLGISVAAAKSRLLRARAELRSRMQRHSGHIGPATLMAS